LVKRHRFLLDGLDVEAKQRLGKVVEAAGGPGSKVVKERTPSSAGGWVLGPKGSTKGRLPGQRAHLHADESAGRRCVCEKRRRASEAHRAKESGVI